MKKQNITVKLVMWWWWFLATPWTIACQPPLSMGFPRQEYWRGLPFPSPGDLPDLGIEPRSPASLADSLPTELQGKLKVGYINFLFIYKAKIILCCITSYFFKDMFS